MPADQKIGGHICVHRRIGLSEVNLMRKKPTRSPLAALLRRTLALFLVMLTLWLLRYTADFGAAAEALQKLAGSGELASALLSAELGSRWEEEGTLAGIDRLAAAQSALLSANLEPVARWLEDHEEEEQPEESSLPQSSAPLFPSPAITADPEVATTTAPDDIIGRTMVPGSSSRYVSEDGIYIYNYTDYSLTVADLAEQFSPWELSDSEGPQILIYHSHTTEAYTMDGTDIYVESDTSRTTDPDFNMIRIGEEMRQVVEAAGLEVSHDDTRYDYPGYSGAYDRSAQGMAAILEEYPSIRLVLDVHRDALTGTDGTVYKTVAATIPGCAQVMMVVGSDAGGQDHDSWEENLSLAVGLQRALVDECGTFARPIVLRSSRFNQQLSTGAILVEVGSHGNTLHEAITAARQFAEVVAAALG